MCLVVGVALGWSEGVWVVPRCPICPPACTCLTWGEIVVAGLSPGEQAAGVVRT